MDHGQDYEAGKEDKEERQDGEENVRRPSKVRHIKPEGEAHKPVAKEGDVFRIGGVSRQDSRLGTF